MKVQSCKPLPFQNSNDCEAFCPPSSSSSAVAALSPFGLLAYATQSVIRVYDVEARVKVFTLVLDCASITALSWKPEVSDGALLAVGDDAGTVTIIDLSTAEQRMTDIGGRVSVLVWDWDSSVVYACTSELLTAIDFKTSEVKLCTLNITPTHLALDAFGLSSLIVYSKGTTILELVYLGSEITSKTVAFADELLQVEFCPWAPENLLVLTTSALILYPLKADAPNCLIGPGTPSYSQFVLSRSTSASFVMVHQDSSISVWTGVCDAESKVVMLECVFQSKSLLGTSELQSLQGAFSLNPNNLSFGLMNQSRVYLFALELPLLKTDDAKLTMTQALSFEFAPTSVVCSSAGVFTNEVEVMIVSPSTFEVSHRRKFPFAIKKAVQTSGKLLLLSTNDTLYEYNTKIGVFKALYTFFEPVIDIAVGPKQLAVLTTTTVGLLNPKTLEYTAKASVDGTGFSVTILDETSVAVSLQHGVWVWRSQESYCVETGTSYRRMVKTASKCLLLDFQGVLCRLEAPDVVIATGVLDLCPTTGRLYYADERRTTGIYLHDSGTSPALLSRTSRRYLRTLLTMTPVSDITRALDEVELPKDLKTCLASIKASWMKHIKDDDDLFTRLINYAKLIGSRREQRFWTLAYQSSHELMMRQLEPRQAESTQSLQSRQLCEANLSMQTLREYETPTKYNRPRVVTPTPGHTRKNTRLKTASKPKTNENGLREASKRTRSMHSSPFSMETAKKRSVSPMIGREHPTVKKVKREGIPTDNTDTLLQLAVNASNLLSTKSDGKISATVRNSMSHFYSNPKKQSETDSKLEKIKGLLVKHPQVSMRVYKACTIAASVSPSVYNDTLQQGAKLLEEECMHEEAAELLFLTGKGLEACVSLQNAGLWSIASKAKIGAEELGAVNMRWAYHLMKQGRTSLSLEVALSSMHLNHVIQILELSGLDELAFSYACFLESRRIIQRSQWHKAAVPYVNATAEISVELAEKLKRDGAADYSGPYASQSLLKLKTEFRSKLSASPWLTSRVF